VALIPAGKEREAAGADDEDGDAAGAGAAGEASNQKKPAIATAQSVAAPSIQ
jgi:hypothetical protein